MSLRNLLPFVLLSSVLYAVPANGQEPASWARDILSSYTNTNRETYLDNRMRAQVVVGDYRAARATYDSLKVARSKPDRAFPPIVAIAYEIFLENKLRTESLDSTFTRVSSAVDDHTAAVAMGWSLTPWLPRMQADYDAVLARVKAKSDVTMQDKLDVVRRAAHVAVFSLISPNIERLLEADDQRRYIITRDIIVRSPQDGEVCVMVWRPRNARGKLTALLNFTVYESLQNTVEARRTASNGYAGVEGLTRGKGCSTNKPVSHEYDGVDAAAVIDWIAKQPWSDGRVGTYGGSYEGMTQWAAAKHMPRALKAMMTSVTHAPGIDFPIDGNIFMTYAYPYPFYVANMKGLDTRTYNDSARWNLMMKKWYESGRPYRELPLIDGTPNPVFERWLSHPSYDAYWKSMVAADSDFARIRIPVLTTTGYFDSGQMGALWFFRQHTKYLPNAEHYLLIGPYEHGSGQRGTMDPLGRFVATNVQGYDLDPIAAIDLGEFRYEWFNYVFKGGPKPERLKDKVNFEVMNGNVWKHAPTLAAMADSFITISPDRSIEHVVDLKDRSDFDKWGLSGDLLDPSSSVRSLIDTTTNVANAITFSSPVFNRDVEVNGLFSGQLAFITNKKDFDVSITLFELTPEGKYVQLNYHWIRASYAKDRSRRELLVPNKRTILQFMNNRLTSRRIQKGSRLVVAIAIEKNPSQQINYGSGKVVADESIADAGEPLRITWLGETRLRVPISNRP